MKTAKNGDFSEEFLSENEFEVALTSFCCCDHGAKDSEAYQEIVLINNSEIWLITRIPPTYVAKKAAEVAQSNNWPMVSFIHNGNKITTWMGHNFKTKSTKLITTFLR